MADGLTQRIAEIRARCGSIARRPATCAPPDGPVAGPDVAGDLWTLVARFEAALHDLATLPRAEAASRRVPCAIDEVDAVVLHTADATDAILDACEQLEAMFASTSYASAVSEAALRIYEACGFQDIVGQRLSKVTRTLSAVEARTAEMLRAFGPPPPGATAPDRAADRPGPRGVMLLDGPAARRTGMDQGSVDAMLAQPR